MTDSSNFNAFQVTATELSTVVHLNEAQKIYRDAVEQIRTDPLHKSLSPAEIDRITAIRSIDDLERDIRNERSQTKVWRTGKRSKLWDSADLCTEFLTRFEKSISVAAQINTTIVTPIWGILFSITIIAREVFDTLKRLNSLEERVRSCLRRFSIYLTEHGLDDVLRESLVDFYTALITFSLTASKIYKRGRRKTVWHALWKSTKAPFDDLLQDLDGLAGEVDKAAHAETFRDVKGLQRAFNRNQSTNTPGVVLSDATVPERLHCKPDLLSNAFTGREEVLGKLSSQIGSNFSRQPLKAAIWGPPGIGKSQTALRFAAKEEEAYRYVFYIHADTRESLLSRYRTIAVLLKLCNAPVEAFEEQEIVEKLKEWLSKSGEWLLIFDSVTEPGIVLEFTPIEGAGSILFTTRSEVVASSLAAHHAYEVRPFSVRTGVQLIRRLQPIRTPSQDQDTVAEELVRMVAGLPIAIEETVQFARWKQIPLASAVKALSTKKDFIRQHHPTSLHEDQLSTGALLKLVLDELVTNYPHAAALFKLLVYFDTSAIPVEMLYKGSAELKGYFSRMTTYDRGNVLSVAEIRTRRSDISERLGWRENNYLKWSTWRHILRTPKPYDPDSYILPRLDSASDMLVAKYFEDNEALQDVLERQIRINDALLDLGHAGIIRRPKDQSIWIHDLFASLTKVFIEDESPQSDQAISHMALVTVFLAYPVPRSDLSIFDTCLLYLPHALLILKHCIRVGLYNDSTAGAELAHIVASVLQIRGIAYPNRISTRGQKTDHEEAILYYRLAFAGYMKAWRRLKVCQGVTDRRILLSTCADQARHSYFTPTFNEHFMEYSRFGRSAPMRCLNTSLKLGSLLATAGQLDEALKYISLAVRGMEVLYGRNDKETEHALRVLAELHKKRGDWKAGYEVMHRAVMSYCGFDENLQTTRGGLISPGGSDLAFQMAFFAEKLGWIRVAVRWLDKSVRGLEEADGRYGPDGTGVLFQFARVLTIVHRHSEAIVWVTTAMNIRLAESSAGTRPEWWIREGIAELDKVTKVECCSGFVLEDRLQRGVNLCRIGIMTWQMQIDLQPLWDELNRSDDAEIDNVEGGDINLGHVGNASRSSV